MSPSLKKIKKILKSAWEFLNESINRLPSKSSFIQEVKVIDKDKLRIRRHFSSRKI